MVSKLRAKRIADRINEVLSEMLIYDVSDPRLVGVSVTDVKVDREMAFANIYVSALEGASRSDEILEGLEHAKGYIRSELADRIELRTFPRLRFHWDPTYERADRIDRLITSLNTKAISSNESQSQLDDSVASDIKIDTDESLNTDG
jgi:ribosome-binding factor A